MDDLREQIHQHVRDAFRTGQTAHSTDRIMALIGEPVAEMAVDDTDGMVMEIWKTQGQRRETFLEFWTADKTRPVSIVPLYALQEPNDGK